MRGIVSGAVVAATSEPGCVVTNGMSQHSRNESNANAGIVVGIAAQDYRQDPEASGPVNPLDGVTFQRHWESRAFELGGGGYQAPAQLVGDFIKGQRSRVLGAVLPSYQPGVQFAHCQRAGLPRRQPARPRTAARTDRAEGGRVLDPRTALRSAVVGGAARRPQAARFPSWNGRPSRGRAGRPPRPRRTAFMQRPLVHLPRCLASAACVSFHRSMPTLAAMPAFTLSACRACGRLGRRHLVDLHALGLQVGEALEASSRVSLRSNSRLALAASMQHLLLVLGQTVPPLLADEHDPRAVDMVGHAQVLLHLVELLREDGVVGVLLAVDGLRLQRAEEFARMAAASRWRPAS